MRSQDHCPLPPKVPFVDIKTASSLHRLRLVSAPEAVSFLLLLVCSVLKRTTEFNAVPVMGAVHGVLFILYVLFWLDAWNRTKWNAKTAALYFVLSVLPFGGFVAERKLRREAEDAVIASRARTEGTVSA
jgi:integral membrane protein